VFLRAGQASQPSFGGVFFRRASGHSVCAGPRPRLTTASVHATAPVPPNRPAGDDESPVPGLPGLGDLLCGCGATCSVCGALHDDCGVTCGASCTCSVCGSLDDDCGVTCCARGVSCSSYRGAPRRERRGRCNDCGVTCGANHRGACGVNMEYRGGTRSILWGFSNDCGVTCGANHRGACGANPRRERRGICNDCGVICSAWVVGTTCSACGGTCRGCGRSSGAPGSTSIESGSAFGAFGAAAGPPQPSAEPRVVPTDRASVACTCGSGESCSS